MRMHIISLTVLASSTAMLSAQSTMPPSEPLDVLGTMTIAEALASDDGFWLEEGRAAYTPQAEVVADLTTALGDVDSVVVFYGSWCGDSRREVPKMLATLRAADFPEGRVVLVGVGDASDDRVGYKQSPDGATEGEAIYRVPTAIFRSGERELGRLLEKPKLSVERDFLAIASGGPYEHAYPVLGALAELDEAGLLDDANVLGYALAHTLEPHAYAANALNSAGYVLLAQKRGEAAVKVLAANARLFPDEANAYDSLAEVLAEVRGPEAAVPYQRRALESAPGDAEILANLEKYIAAAAAP